MCELGTLNTQLLWPQLHFVHEHTKLIGGTKRQLLFIAEKLRFNYSTLRMFQMNCLLAIWQISSQKLSQRLLFIVIFEAQISFTITYEMRDQCPRCALSGA